MVCRRRLSLSFVVSITACSRLVCERIAGASAQIEAGDHVCMSTRMGRRRRSETAVDGQLIEKGDEHLTCTVTSARQQAARYRRQQAELQG